MNKVACYCLLCRTKEIELYGTILSTVGPRHERAVREAGCKHPAALTLTATPAAPTPTPTPTPTATPPAGRQPRPRPGRRVR
jgi:hypothetical protein